MKLTNQDSADKGGPLCIVMKDDFLREIVANVLSRLPHVSKVFEFKTCLKAQQSSDGMQCRVVLIEISQAALCEPYCKSVRTQSPGARIVVLAEPEECNAASAAQLGADIVVSFTGLIQAIEDFHTANEDQSRLIS
jgi:DNA-binding NarL/FixJ family response regulator